MDSNPLNHDVVSEILLHLPSISLLKFRSVCKSWRHLIDSQDFIKSHVQQHADDDHEDDDTQLVQFRFCRDRVSELSMVFPHNGKSYNDFPPPFKEFFDEHLNPSLTLTETGRQVTEFGRFVRIVGPVNGLICIYHRKSNGPVAVCNPSLGKIKILPISPTCSIDRGHHRDVGICFDKVAQDYVVVQLLSCHGHRCLHASMYSRATNSWRELILDNELHIRSPIKSSCKKGSFFHWRAFQVVGERRGEEVILSFNVENGAFRILDMAADIEYWKRFRFGEMKIFAEGDDSFLMFIYRKFDINCNGKGPKSLKILRSRIEGNNTLCWDLTTSVGPFPSVVIPKALCERDCVVLNDFSKNMELVFYDYCDQECVGRFKMKRPDTFKIFQYRGSFVLP